MRAGVTALLPVALAVGACGLGHAGTISGAPVASSGADASPDGPCPAARPSAGTACPDSFAGLCEYGADPDYICNSSLECRGGLWTSTPPASTNAAGAACPTPRDSACPASIADITNGAACGVAMTCGYADGICDCIVPPLMPQDVPRSWFCDRADIACPSPRPRVGSACETDGQTCDYGACSIAEGLVLGCTDGTWQPTTMACPL